jgi:glutamate racemase
VLAYAGVETLFSLGAQVVIVACNTVSAEALRRLQDDIFNHKYPDRRVLGVIIPTIEILYESDTKNVLLVGTERTVNSGKYIRELSKISDDIVMDAIATPELVPMIEAHAFDDAFDSLINSIDAQMGDVDTLVLGCTHYTVLKDQIRKKYPNVEIVSQDEIIPTKLENYLERHPEIETKLTHGNSLDVVLSAESDKYTHIKKMFFSM